MLKKFFESLQKSPLLLFSLGLIIAAFLLFIPNDPDFFWHLKYGELTLDQGPISTDHFSHTFSEYQFFDYQWLSHVIIFSLYKIGGFFTVAAFYGLMVFLSLVISTSTPIKKHSSKISKFIMMLIGLMIMKPVIGIRPQMATLLGISLVYFLLISFLKNSSRAVYFIPLVMLVWANLHPGFLSGIILISIVIFSESLKLLLQKFTSLRIAEPAKKNSIKILLIILFFSVIATVFTPFFYNILKQTILYSSDSYQREHIVEWLPLNFQEITGQATILYMLFVIYSIFKAKNFNLTEILIVAVFGFLSLQSVRHIPLFVVISIPTVLANPDWKILEKLNSLRSNFLLFIESVFLFASVIILCFTGFRFLIINSSEKEIYKEVEYPYEAVSFLKDKNYEGDIFNNYGWGGFLIWEYPEKKTFIDGRMTSWKIDDTLILEEYDEISGLLTPDWEQKLEEYNVSIILSDTSTPLCNALRNSDTWEVVYEDELSVVLYKK